MTRLGRAVAAAKGALRTAWAGVTGTKPDDKPRSDKPQRQTPLLNQQLFTRRDPIWAGRSRSALRESKTSASDTTSPSALRLKRQRDRKMREGLPRMSGRQWTKLRKLMYRRAKAQTLHTQETAP